VKIWTRVARLSWLFLFVPNDMIAHHNFHLFSIFHTVYVICIMFTITWCVMCISMSFIKLMMIMLSLVLFMSIIDDHTVVLFCYLISIRVAEQTMLILSASTWLLLLYIFLTFLITSLDLRWFCWSKFIWDRNYTSTCMLNIAIVQHGRN